MCRCGFFSLSDLLLLLFVSFVVKKNNFLWSKRRFYSIEILNYLDATSNRIRNSKRFYWLSLHAGAWKMHIIKMANLITEPMMSSCTSMTNNRCLCSRYTCKSILRSHHIVYLIFNWMGNNETNESISKYKRTPHNVCN